MGAAAHGIGTAQMGDEPDAQPFAAIAMSLVGAASVVAAATPASRALLLRAAEGASSPRRGAPSFRLSKLRMFFQVRLSATFVNLTDMEQALS